MLWGGKIGAMTGKLSVVIEQDEQGCYAWRPELKGCQSQGRTIEETLGISGRRSSFSWRRSVKRSARQR